MIYFLQQLLNGLTTGAVYASLGLALVLIYRTTNIANFAQGEMATFSAFMSWQLHEWGLQRFRDYPEGFAHFFRRNLTRRAVDPPHGL